MDEEIIFHVVYHHRRVLIKKMSAAFPPLGELDPDLSRQWYCGYVETFAGEYYHEHPDLTELDLMAYGGVTWVGSIPNLPSENNFFAIGFDTNHCEQRQWTKDQLKTECISLANQLDLAGSHRLKDFDDQN